MTQINSNHLTQTQSLYLYGCAGWVAWTCVAYELLLGSYATFLMGASLFQYSLVISLMMLSMGLGSLISKPLAKECFTAFYVIENLLAVCAVTAVPILYLSFALNFSPSSILVVFVSFIGLAIGLEIPLLNEMSASNSALARILFFDYIGGFVGGLAFPIILLPTLGYFRLGAFLGLMNSLIAVSFLYCFREKIKGGKTRLALTSLAILTLSVLGFFFAEQLRQRMEFKFFQIS
jgi:spermidine synthase